jgi:hypothetical protein
VITQWIFAFGLGALLLVLVLSVLMVAREHQALQAFTAEMTRMFKTKSGVSKERALLRLSGESRDAAGRFESALRSGKSVDEALSESISSIAGAELRASAVLAIALDAALCLIASSPMLWSLGACAGRIARLWAAARTMSGPRLYADGLRETTGAFIGLRAGFEASAVLFGIAAIVWSARWLLLRPEVREARVIHAVLKAAVSVKQGAQAPLGARLAKLLAPSVSIGPAVVGGLILFLSLTSSFLILSASAELRRDNVASRAITELWRGDSERSAKIPEDLELPIEPAGSPLKGGLSMIVRADRSADKPRIQVKIASGRDLELENGTLPKDWQAEAERTVASMREPGRPIDMRVLAHRDLGMQAIVPVLQVVKGGLGVDRYLLVVLRALDSPDGATPIQAGIDLLVDSSEDLGRLPVKLKVSPESVEILGGNEPSAPVSFGHAHWTSEVRDQVRRRLGSLDTPQLRVAVQTTPETTYNMLLRVLGAADSMCEGGHDCGLPGLGIRFFLDRGS